MFERIKYEGSRKKKKKFPALREFRELSRVRRRDSTGRVVVTDSERAAAVLEDQFWGEECEELIQCLFVRGVNEDKEHTVARR